jgi:hypothetical protein
MVLTSPLTKGINMPKFSKAQNILIQVFSNRFYEDHEGLCVTLSEEGPTISMDYPGPIKFGPLTLPNVSAYDAVLLLLEIQEQKSIKPISRFFNSVVV